MKKFKTIGILGGMGPGASADLYQKIITIAQKKYNAVQDTDYPPIIINSICLQGFDETGIRDSDLIKDQLLKEVKRLENAGADFIVMPCNTTHAFYKDMQKVISIPFLNLISETSKLVTEKTVGVLCSMSTRTLKLYEAILEQEDIITISATDNEQEEINQAVEAAMGEGLNKNYKKGLLKKIIDRMQQDGAESIILGCTELPLLISQSDTDMKVYDTLQILAEFALEESRS